MILYFLVGIVECLFGIYYNNFVPVIIGILFLYLSLNALEDEIKIENMHKELDRLEEFYDNQ